MYNMCIIFFLCKNIFLKDKFELFGVGKWFLVLGMWFRVSVVFRSCEFRVEDIGMKYFVRFFGE